MLGAICIGANKISKNGWIVVILCKIVGIMLKNNCWEAELQRSGLINKQADFRALGVTSWLPLSLMRSTSSLLLDMQCADRRY